EHGHPLVPAADGELPDDRRHRLHGEDGCGRGGLPRSQPPAHARGVAAAFLAHDGAGQRVPPRLRGGVIPLVPLRVDQPDRPVSESYAAVAASSWSSWPTGNSEMKKLGPSGVLTTTTVIRTESKLSK